MLDSAKIPRKKNSQESMTTAISSLPPHPFSGAKRKDRETDEIDDKTYEAAIKRFGIHESPLKEARGAYASAVLNGNDFVAKKQSPWKSVNPEQHVKVIERENEILKILTEENAPNIVKLEHTVRSGERRFAFILEKAGQNLYQKYKTNKATIADVKRIGKQILRALIHMHTGTEKRKPIGHFDLKPENIAEDHRGYVRLLDFGLSEQVGPAGASTQKFTVSYRPPEAHFRIFFGVNADIWSLACILFELATGEILMPWWLADGNQFDLSVYYAYKDRLVKMPAIEAVKRKRPDFFDASGELKPRNTVPPLEPYIDALKKQKDPEIDQLIDLLSKMLIIDPKQRKSAAELIEHPFFQDAVDIAPPIGGVRLNFDHEED